MARAIKVTIRIRIVRVFSVITPPQLKIPPKSAFSAYAKPFVFGFLSKAVDLDKWRRNPPRALFLALMYRIRQVPTLGNGDIRLVHVLWSGGEKKVLYPDHPQNDQTEDKYLESKPENRIPSYRAKIKKLI
jgi:hypothetical protein